MRQAKQGSFYTFVCGAILLRSRGFRPTSLKNPRQPLIYFLTFCREVRGVTGQYSNE
jgi:hypothetical protein